MLISLVAGLAVGVVYGLFAVGLVLTYRVSRVLNFAHGTIGTLGALVFNSLWLSSHIALWLALVCGVAVAGTIGAAADLVIVRPLRTKPPIVATLATFGLSALLFSYASRHYGSRPVATKPLLEGSGVHVGGVQIQPVQLLMLGVSISALAGLTLLIYRTSFGLKLRAIAQDAGIAEQLGIRADVVSLTAWCLASMLAALCGILLASQVSFSVSFMQALVLRGLIAALVGGLTSIGGAFLAGIGIGAVESLLQFKLATPGAPEAALAALVVIVLVIRPTGLRRAEY